MNIAFDAKRITHNATGLGNYSRYIMRILAEYYPENDYLLLSTSEGNKHLYSSLMEHRNIKLQTPESQVAQVLSGLWRNFGLKNILKEEDIDIYHGLSNEIPIGLYKSEYVRTIVTIHDLAFIRYPEFYNIADRYLYKWKYGASARKADHVIAVSEYTKKDIVEILGVPEEKISVVYQGCSPRFASVKPEQIAFCRGSYQLPRRYMLFVGSIEERKNLKLAVQALALLEDKEIELVAVGRATPYCSTVLSEARRLGVSKRLRLMHNVPTEHLAGIYAGAELFVYPSRFEGFGIPLIEALNTGTPVIGATGSCLEEAGGPHSLYTDPDDAEMLADMMARVLSDRELRQTMIEEGKSYAKRFADKSVARNLRKVYEQVLLG